MWETRARGPIDDKLKALLICSNCKILIYDLFGFGGRTYGNGSAKWLYNKELGCCLSCRQTIDTKLYWVILHSEKDTTIKIKQPKKKIPETTSNLHLMITFTCLYTKKNSTVWNQWHRFSCLYQRLNLLKCIWLSNLSKY